MSDLHASQDTSEIEELLVDSPDDFDPPEQSGPEPVDPPVGDDGYPISGSAFKSTPKEAC